MTHPVRVWSSAYSPSLDTNLFSVQVPSSIWTEATRSETSRRKFLRIQHPEGLDDWIAPLGSPLFQQETQTNEYDPIENIYLPLWMIDAGHFKGDGEETTLEVLGEDSFPEATHIVFRVVDSAFYNADVKEELEKALSAMGVIRQYSTLQIPIQALGGYPVEVFVSKTEPANVVLCDGEEVSVEFEEPVDQIRPPTPVPDLSHTTMIPSDVQIQQSQAFQGEGRRLGGSNAAGPEWRRGLPPPRRR